MGLEGNAIVLVDDFAAVTIDSVSIPDVAFIEGRVKPDMISVWVKATEEMP